MVKSRLIVCFIICMLAIPLVFAVDIDKIKMYVNNERITDIDVDDGGEADVRVKDVIDMTVTLLNDYNFTIQGKIRLTAKELDNGDDIEKTQDWFDIPADDTKSKTLSFTIPEDANVDDYDLILRVYSKVNGTEDYVDKEYTLSLLKKSEEVYKVNYEAIISNMSSSCKAMENTAYTCFNYVGRYNNCSDQLSTVAEERGTYKQQSEDLSGKLTECNSQKNDFEEKSSILESQISGMYTHQQCNNLTATEVSRIRKDGDSKFNTLIGGILLVGIGYYIYNNNRKKKGGVATSFEADYMKGRFS